MVELPKLAVVAVDPSGIDVMLLAATVPEEPDKPEMLDDGFMELTKPVEPNDIKLVTAPLEDEAPKMDVGGFVANELVVVGCPNPLSPVILTIRKDLSCLPPKYFEDITHEPYAADCVAEGVIVPV